MELNVYKSFSNSKRKKLISLAMGVLTLASIPTLSACKQTQFEESTSVSLSDEYLDKLNDALNNKDCKVTYVEKSDLYIIDNEIYKYDINDPSYKEYLRTEQLTLSGTMARSLGYSEILDNKINTKKIGK